MKITDILEIITKKTGMPVNQSKLAKSLDVTRQTICNRIKNNSELTVSELNKIESYFGIKIFQQENIETEWASVDFYPEVLQAAAGELLFSRKKKLRYNYQKPCS